MKTKPTGARKIRILEIKTAAGTERRCTNGRKLPVEIVSTKHTPGPWSVGVDNCGNGRNINHFRDYIGHTCGYEARPGSQERTLSQEEAEANARLIAAAPELLEALKAMVEPFDESDTNCQIVAALAAIAKAEGATS